MTSTTLREMLVKQEPRCVSICYVCAGMRAEYIISSKPYGENPFFPFLEQHQPPEGAESMRSDGRVLVCNVCFNLLNQQWNSFEKSKTPYTKRLYWLKRLDNGPFAGMDLNLQQDYESLFEASSSGVDNDIRKSKQQRSPFPSTSNVIKPKSSEYSDPTFQNAIGFHMQGSEKPGLSASNILDLTVSTSRSSSSVSPGLTSEVCYICGQESKCYLSVYVNAIPHCPFFPSLRTHTKPTRAKPIDVDGSVHACKQCHASLISQWDYYQKQGVPHQERLYKTITSSAMCSEISSKDKTFVCFTCGMVAQLSVQRFISAFQEKGEPFFSFLLHISPHPGANKLSNGKACVCSVCYKSLFRQYRVFDVSNTPEERRKYKILNESVPNNSSVLRQHLENTSREMVAESKLVCYLCESLSDSFISVNTVPSDEMYFPFIRSFPKPANAIPIDVQGQVKVCSQCHLSLRYQWQAFEHASIPINQRQYKIPFSKSQEAEYQHMSSLFVPPAYSNVEDRTPTIKRGPEKCGLCERSFNEEHVYFLDTLPREKCMHFPSLCSLVKQSNCIDQYGRIPSCNHCYAFLKNQWEIFESAHVPHSQRQYEIGPPKVEREHVLHYSNESRLSEASAALHIQVSSPDLKIDLSKHSSNEPLLTTVNTMPVSSITLTNAPIAGLDKAEVKVPKQTSDEPATRISGPLDVPYVRPLLLVPINCFVCGELNSSGLTYAIKSQPTSKPEDRVPFFPFLSKHVPQEGSEKLANDGSALTCMFCYHSLMSQWYAYEASPYPEDENPWHRRYNTHNYVCFICGITTYRKRACSISVKNFPFLLEHKRPNGALTLLNGECVVTCQTCFESITSQWKDFERMKVPIEMRMYNWIVLPPPPDDENSRGCQILQEASGAAANLQVKESDQTNVEESGIPHGLKPSPSHLGLPPAPYGLTKPVGHSMMSPVHQGAASHPNTAFTPFPGNVNQALNATRASSFAAALRKLAKQAVDPITDKELSPISPATSPASSQHSNHNRHIPPLPVYMNNHNPNPPGHGSPTPMMSASQGKVLDLGRYSNSNRNGNMMDPVGLKMEGSKMQNSNNDKRSDMIGVKHVPPQTMPHNMRQDNNLTRGFQPYRNPDERHPTPPHMYNPSPPPNTMSGYTYHHPSLVQSSRLPPQSYRLEDSVYMERYGLLRPSSTNYPPPHTTNISHPRVPHYPSSQYPPDLIPQSVRSAPSNNTTYSTSRHNQEEENVKENNIVRQREMEIYQERERLIEREVELREREAEYYRRERNHMRQSPVPPPLHSTGRTEGNEDKGHMGSIIHGTPRDYVRSISPVPSSAPLNLATNISHMDTQLVPKEEYNSRHLRQNNNNLVNGQSHQRNSNHHTGHNYYRKEPDVNLPHRPPYQINISRENESKPQIYIEAAENKASHPHRSKNAYFMERENKNSSNTFETRTLSMASVINSQINGIFAREKFPSNNSFDFMNSLVAKSEQSPDNQSKMESDFKRVSPPQEKFSSTPKELESEKMHVMENVKSEPLSNKLPAYMFNVPPTLFRSEYPDNYKLKDFSSTRTIPSNQENSSSLESADKQSHIVSVLDAREDRLRKLRMTREVTESEESDIESEEEDEERLKVLLTIKKGPPTKMDPDPKKLQFFSKLDLTTHSKKQAIELRKCIKRHQALREKSLSPVVMEPKKEVEIEYDVEHLNELAKRLCFEETFPIKNEFLESLKLKFIPPEQREEKERIDKVILKDKLRRNGLLKASEDIPEIQGSILGKREYPVLNNVKLESVKKPNISQNQNLNSNLDKSFGEKKILASRDKTPPLPFLQKKVSTFLKPPMKTVNLPVPPLIPTNQIPSFSEPQPDKGTVIAPKDPRVRQINKDFVQEFHNSVLQTTQMQLEKKNISNPSFVEHTFCKVPDDDAAEKFESYAIDRPVLKWPGVEAVMESYMCHISEQTAEKKFLVDSCQRLKALNQDSNIEAECLQKKTEELMQEKMYLDTEKRELQKRVESLKLFIEHFR